MAGRPRDWHPVADSDPIPGDPRRVAELGKKLRKTADELEKQIKSLKAVADVEAWDSKAGKEFREKAKGNVKKLEAAFKRYDTAADAFGSEVTEVGGGYEDKAHAKSTDYASDLNRAQEIADIARKEAQDAEERKSAHQKSLDGLSDKGKNKEQNKDDKKKLEEARDNAGNEIEAAKAKVERAREIRDDAAKHARDAIEDVISDDSLKDGFWETLVDDIKSVMEVISTVCGVLSLIVGWIPIIGQALAGVLGAIAMIATLIGTIATIIQVFQGNADMMDLGMAALGFLMMGVGKAFSKVAGKYAKTALSRMGSARTAKTAAQVRRAKKGVNRASGDGFQFDKSRPASSLRESVAGKLQQFKLQKGEGWNSLKEPFKEPFSPSAWGDNLRTLKPGSGNYREMWGGVASRGDGNVAVGAGRSFSMADPGVASQLKEIKFAASALGGSPAVNRISNTATGLSLAGAGVTLGGLGLDGNLNPLLE
ncbi:putative T7SS-secreted protein [Streptomyces sp. NPDC048436]|uniref:putative T7SS-secreted protein n=1 Tax=Streptomyces sp. NPDC048436 TaxID=3365550 RepID=UPI00371AC481